MEQSLQATLRESKNTTLVLGYYCGKRDRIFCCKNGKIIERLAGWQMPHFINKYVVEEGAE